jgi:hypothetical protein
MSEVNIETFRRYCTHKVPAWDQFENSPRVLSESERSYLDKLPILETWQTTRRPFDPIPVPAQEFILIRNFGGNKRERYYVNTEGYSYLRYSFHIPT